MYGYLWIDLCICWQDDKSADAKAYEEAASGIDDIPFGITSDADLFKEYEVESDGIVLFKKVNLTKIDTMHIFH